MDEVVERAARTRRRRRAAVWIAAVLAVLVLLGVVVWQVVARTARLEPGSLSWWDGPTVASCAIRDDEPAANVVGSQDPEARVVYSVRNPNRVAVRLTAGDDVLRFQRELFDPTGDFQGAPSEDLVDSVVVPPGEEAFVQLEPDMSGSWISGSYVSLSLGFDVLGIERSESLAIDPVVLLVNGSSADATLVAEATLEGCGT